MRGKGISTGRFNPRSCSTKKLGKSHKESFGDVIIIDDDDRDPSSGVIFIDITESLQDELEDPRVERRQNNCAFEDVITIDDDDDHSNECSISSQPGTGVEGIGDLDSDATSNKPFLSAGKYSSRTSWLRADKCQVTREKESTSKSKECRRTSSKSSFSRNRYGLSSESENSSSDSEFPDCEIMEDFRKQWEQASRKRRNQVGSNNRGSASGSMSDTCKNDELGNKSVQHAEATVCSNSRNSSCGEGKSSSFVETSNYKFWASFLDTREQIPMEFDQEERESSSSQFQSGPSGNLPTYWKENYPYDEKTNREWLFSAGERESHRHKMDDRTAQCTEEEQGPEWSSLRSNHNQHANGNSSPTTSSVSDKEPIYTRQSHMCDLKSKLDIDFEKKLPGDDGEEDDLSKHMNKKFVDCDGVVFTHYEGNCSMPSGCCTFSDSQSKNKNTICINIDNNVPRQPLKSRHSNRTQANCSDAYDFGGDRNIFSVSNPSLGKSGIIGTGTHPWVDTINPDEKENEPIIESATSRDQCCDRKMLQSDCNGFMQSARVDIITNRENLKKTDEYKRAMEEEWVARQEQLRIQAEEAQRLRKRRRAESMRLLEMERRQKQRLEEIRDTQRKDEENMNLKEQLQGLIRRELDILESKSYDMASLLRGLGIHVGGGFSPSSQEVHAAYKRAVLKFHPDRASRSDIRLQVEAEEKFKLIARMKEKRL